MIQVATCPYPPTHKIQTLPSPLFFTPAKMTSTRKRKRGYAQFNTRASQKPVDFVTRVDITRSHAKQQRLCTTSSKVPIPASEVPFQQSPSLQTPEPLPSSSEPTPDHDPADRVTKKKKRKAVSHSVTVRTPFISFHAPTDLQHPM